MKTFPSSPDRSGAVLVFALLLLVVGALVLGGVAQMTATQSVAGETEWTAMERRVQLENSRAMARQYLLSRMFTGSAPGIAVDNDFGGFNLTDRDDVGNFWATRSETGVDARLNINPFNMMERGGFYRVWIPGTVSDGVNNVGWNFQIRTRSPLAAGFTFVKHRPSAAPVGLYAAPPYIDMTAPGAFVGFEGLPRLPVSSVTNLNPSGDTTGYLGHLDVPIGASEAGDFTDVIFTLGTDNASLQAELDLGAVAAGPGSVLAFNVPASASYTNEDTTVVNLPVQAVVLKGAPLGDNDFPVHVVVGTGNPNVNTLVLSNSNLRRVYVNVQRPVNDGSVFRVTATNASVWRMGMTASKVDVNFDTGTVPIKGGIRTDGNVTFPLGTAYFTPETDPRGLDVIGDRMMWLEDNREL